MVFCSVRGCENRTETSPGLKFYTFPNNSDLREQWRKFCDPLKQMNCKTARICSAHFEPKYKMKRPQDEALGLSPKRFRNLKSNAVPTLKEYQTETEDVPITVESSEQIGNYDLTQATGILQQGSDCGTHLTDQISTKEISRTSEPLQKIGKKIDEIIAENESLLQGSSSTSFMCISQNEWTKIQERLEACTSREKFNTFHETNYLKATKENEYFKKFAEAQLKEKEEEIKKLKYQISGMEESIQNLKKNENMLIEEKEVIKNNLEKHEKALKTYFTPGQIKKIFSSDSNKRIRWTNEDIASAISLRCASIKGYRYLKFKANHPLPDISTLRRWARKISMEEGILRNVLSLMQKYRQQMKKNEHLTVLAFDEMSVSSYYCFEKSSGKVYGDIKKVQVIMARGLISSWKQPIAYFFDTDMSKEILLKTIESLYAVNFNVTAIVCDLGATNRILLRELNISSDQTYFCHPANNKLKIFCFADVPHLMKLARNHFLDEGFIYNGCEIRKDCVEKILDISSSELKMSFRLSRARHLDVQGPQRQRVGPAVELMSEMTAALIEYCSKHNLINVRNYEVVVDFFRTIGKWFYLFNNIEKLNQLKDVEAYGLTLDKQVALLKKMSEMINDVRIIKKLKNGLNTKAKLPFQQGMILSSKALEEMFVYLHETYKVEFLLTRRLNQDTLESFFGYIRGMGATNDHPLPTEFKQRLKLYTLGKNSSVVFTLNRNTEDLSSENCLVTPTKVFCKSKPQVKPQTPEESCSLLRDFDEEFLEGEERLLTGELKKIVGDEEEGDPTDIIGEKEVEQIYSNMESSQISPSKVVESEGLKYLAGYVAHHFRGKHLQLAVSTSEIEETNNSWIKFISKGNLLYPAPGFVDILKKVDECFNIFHGPGKIKQGVDSISAVFQISSEKLKEEIKEEKLALIPKEVLIYFIRVRTFIRIRELNIQKKMDNTKKSSQKKFNNKMNKLTS